MERDAQYAVDVDQHELWRVGEEQEHYTLLLGQAIERYLDGLRDAERRISQGEDDPDAMAAEIAALNDSMLRVCAQFEQEVRDENVIKETRSYFRKRTHSLLSKSYAINRCRTWPRGHQGDFLTLETAYRNTALSDGIGNYLDRYLMDSALGHGVRGRIDRLSELLADELSRREGASVLDIACGSCRELQSIMPEIKRSGARFTCIDLDNEALNFAMDRLSAAELHPDQLLFVNYNALRLFDLEIAEAEFGTQDVIYSVGFFDYLPDEFLVKLLHTLFALLRPGGSLIMAFKDADRYAPQLYHWLVDWDGFLQRRQPDIDRLLHSAGIPAGALTTMRDRSGTILFYTARKQ
jgi:2-polyprenyl-3-methyl-5-hydroxy-6-metoxy-1,4-benzoquinol methylase